MVVPGTYAGNHYTNFYPELKPMAKPTADKDRIVKLIQTQGKDRGVPLQFVIDAFHGSDIKKSLISCTRAKNFGSSLVSGGSRLVGSSFSLGPDLGKWFTLYRSGETDFDPANKMYGPKSVFAHRGIVQKDPDQRTYPSYRNIFLSDGTDSKTIADWKDKEGKSANELGTYQMCTAADTPHFNNAALAFSKFDITMRPVDGVTDRAIAMIVTPGGEGFVCDTKFAELTGIYEGGMAVWRGTFQASGTTADIAAVESIKKD